MPHFSLPACRDGPGIYTDWQSDWKSSFLEQLSSQEELHRLEPIYERYFMCMGHPPAPLTYAPFACPRAKSGVSAPGAGRQLPRLGYASKLYDEALYA